MKKKRKNKGASLFNISTILFHISTFDVFDVFNEVKKGDASLRSASPMLSRGYIAFLLYK